MTEKEKNLFEKKNFLPVELKYIPDTATAILEVSAATIDFEKMKKIADQRGLSQKNEFHFTIIGRATGEEILEYADSLEDNDKKELLKKIEDLCNSFNWQVELLPEYFYIKKDYNGPEDDPDIRESIIQMATIHRLDDFYQNLNTLVNKNFETPIPHITIYTTSTREEKKLRGIGIYSKKQFEELNPKEV